MQFFYCHLSLYQNPLNLHKPVTYTNLPHSLCQVQRACARRADKPGKLQGQHTCSAHARLIAQFAYVCFQDSIEDERSCCNLV